MDGYISIQEAIDAVESDLKQIDPLDPGQGIMKACIRRAVWRLKQVQFTDVRPVVRGRWIDNGFTLHKCSLCGCEDAFCKPSNYCPNCGADMRGWDS